MRFLPGSCTHPLAAASRRPLPALWSPSSCPGWQAPCSTWGWTCTLPAVTQRPCLLCRRRLQWASRRLQRALSLLRWGGTHGRLARALLSLLHAIACLGGLGIESSDLIWAPRAGRGNTACRLLPQVCGAGGRAAAGWRPCRCTGQPGLQRGAAPAHGVCTAGGLAPAGRGVCAAAVRRDTAGGGCAGGRRSAAACPPRQGCIQQKGSRERSGSRSRCSK